MIIEDEFKVEYIPFESTEIGIKAIENEEKVLSDFYTRSLKISDPDFVRIKYKSFSEKNKKLFAFFIRFR